MPTPSDPLYASQWHLTLLGDIERIWSEYTGTGIKIGVYDSGVQTAHADLNDNIGTDTIHEFSENDYAEPVSYADDPHHGTAVAGLIGAEQGNGIGGVGVAWGADLYSVNIFHDDLLDAETYYASLHFAQHYDIMNNSWGYGASYSADRDPRVTDSQAQFELAEYQYAVENGRSDGVTSFGTVILQAAGNEASNANGDGLTASRYVIAVGALDTLGDVTDYSNYGASVFVSAGAASVTTDRSSSSGYNTTSGAGGDYANDFGGTSAATPVTSGVVALMLEANAHLGWRDVREILALSARLTGGITTGQEAGEITGNEVGGTQFQTILDSTGGDTWNDGGRAFSIDYGFGAVDAYAAVRMAEVWGLMNSDAKVAANETSVSASNAVAQTEALAAHADGEVESSVTVAGDFWVENVVVDVAWTMDASPISGDLDYQDNYLRLSLIAPDGTAFYLDDAAWWAIDDDASISGDWQYGLVHALGMSAAGEWTVQLELEQDAASNASVNLEITAFDITFYGAEWDAANIHTITQDWGTAQDKDTVAALRDGIIVDDNGGEDWLNMAALQGDIEISLVSSEDFTVDGDIWGSISGGTTIENIVTGDGNDTIMGNESLNTIYGMRGDDSISGGALDDVLDGGAGIDWAFFTSDNDITVDLTVTVAQTTGEGSDILLHFENVFSGGGDDSLTGDAAANWLIGGAGADTLIGSAGNDTIEGGTGNDSLDGGDGTDVLVLNAAAGFAFDMTLGTITTSDGVDTITGFEGVVGGAGADTLTGDTLANYLLGGGGDDSIIGDAGDDTIGGGAGNDSLAGGAGANTLIFDFAAITVNLATTTGQATGEGNDTITGFDNLITGAGADRLTGNANANRITASAGNDTLYGGSGGDTLYGDENADLVYGGAGLDTLYGGDSGDTLYGDGENDVIYGGAGSERAYGGDGTDRLYGEAGTDTLYGGAGNDGLSGGDASDYLYGDAGADSLYGGNANDRLYGGDSNDLLYGGFGNDILYGSTSNDRLYGDGGNDILYGESGLDLVYAGDGADRAYGSTSNDSLYGGAGNDTLYGGDYNDRIYGGTDRDTLFGDAGRDLLYGGDGNDRLDGGSSNDSLFGDAGTDLLYGGSSSDKLYGGTGTDVLYGGSSGDAFYFTKSGGKDMVYDFANNSDTLYFSKTLWGGASMSVKSMVAKYGHASGSNFVFDFGSDEITVRGLKTASSYWDDITII